jgi:hypothetical protein
MSSVSMSNADMPSRVRETAPTGLHHGNHSANPFHAHQFHAHPFRARSAPAMSPR